MTTKHGVRRVSGSVISLLLLMVSLPVLAQSSDRQILTVTPLGANGFLFGGFSDPIPVGSDGEEVALSFDDGLGYGLSATARMSDRLSLEILGNRLRSEVDLPLGSVVAGLRFAYYSLYAGGVYRLRDGAADTRPYLAAGVGAKWYDFDSFEQESNLAWNVGVGLDVTTAWIADVRLDLRDYMSVFSAGETELGEGDVIPTETFQHDVILNVGLAFGLF